MADLRHLAGWFQGPVAELIRYARSLDSRFIITSGFRSFGQQAQLYRRSLQCSGAACLPAAPPGRSFHNLGRAVDIARPGVMPFEDDLLPLLGALWNQAGGTWHPSDPVHFQA